MLHHTYIALTVACAILLGSIFFSATAAFAWADDSPSEPTHLSKSSSATNAPETCPDPDMFPRAVPPADQVTLPILMYHHITHLAANASSTWRTLTVTPEAFEAQVKYLADHGYHAIYFSNLVAYFQNGVPLPEKPIILTFDDGWVDDYKVAYPILRKYCMVGTFFPPINWVNNGGGMQVMDWPMIEEMSRGGMEFGSHTLNHHLLNNLNETQIRQQLVDSKAEIEKHVVRPVVALAYPGGGYNALVVSLVPKAGYSAAVGVTANPDQLRANLFTLHRTTITYSDNLEMFERRLRGPNKNPAVATSVLPWPRRPDSLRWPDHRFQSEP